MRQQPVPQQEIGRWRRGDETDLLVRQHGIADRRRLDAIGRARHEHIAGVVVGVRRLHDRVAGHGPHDEIALPRPQGIADEANHLGEPDIADRQLQVGADEVGDLVLEALLLLVREGQVVRIGTYAEFGSRDDLRPLRNRTSIGQHPDQDRAAARRQTPPRRMRTKRHRARTGSRLRGRPRANHPLRSASVAPAPARRQIWL